MKVEVDVLRGGWRLVWVCCVKVGVDVLRGGWCECAAVGIVDDRGSGRG